MNVLCPKCQALFRIDPERVPPAGARVRCSRCAEIFPLSRNGAAPASAAPARPGASTAAGPFAPPRTATPGPRPAAAPAPHAPAPAPANAPPPPPAVATRPAPAPAAAAPAAARPRRSFAAQDPDARAERIARALVSDIVAYNPERRDKSLASGTLRGEFREEIVKSWEEYVAQVGPELARKTPHFRNALNEILARGQSVF